ncbi:hypothetical protein AWZ03_010285 [Drosophila navojoa]|uniref:RNA helicase n=1 Tax=Drosophila navojoa TaxID=7232 RepID=A0A484B3H9_DRONA|nr:putative ATP-dependent RNA helicase BoYb [Drosophila navojoa]TDG43313.1 hypothetical protein AWZ03_010285 [Drosophila navojoa]
MWSAKCLTDDNNNDDDESLCYDENRSFSFAQHCRPLLVANCSDYAVAHSNKRLQPARHVNEVSFLPHIQGAMRRLRLTQLLRLQSYAWPHLNQGAGHGAVIVSAPRSGRTLSYVLPLCQVVSNTLTEHRSRARWCLEGPIALVLVTDLVRVQQVSALCAAMLRKSRNEEWLTLVLTVPSSYTPEFFQRLLNGVGCMVATPAQFLWVCGNSLKLPHLRFVAYDDADLMQAEQLKQAHQQLLLLTNPERPQLVISSQSYKPQLLSKLREFNSQLMVLFGDVLEAAIYGGTRLQISLQQRKAKCQEVLRVLRERPPHSHRTVVNCQSDSDIRELVETLVSHGYNCLPYYQTADLKVRDHVHRWMQDSRGELLLCTDHCPELDVRHAHTLLHYSLSDSWSLFKLRHLALADNLNNQLAATDLKQQTGQQQSEQDRLLSLVLLDESNNNQLPRLVDFLQMHQEVDKLVVQLARRIRMRIERAKSNESALCQLMLSFGECVDTQCEQRHQLLMHDRLLPPQMPARGDVKLQLIRVYTPTHYCVRLLEHLPPGGSWQALSRNGALELQLQLLQSQECVRVWPPLVNQICVYRNSSGYERVRILRVDPIAQLNLSRSDLSVSVQALDVDTRQFTTTSGKLFICPEQLQDEPPLAIDVRIVGLVPYTGERDWHESDGKQCESWLNSTPKPSFLQARILMVLSHTVFVHDLAVTSYAPNLQLHVRSLTICQQLLRKQLAKKCKKAEAKLLQFLERDPCQALDLPEMSELPRQKPNMKTATLLTGRAGIFVKMALQLGKQNRLRLLQKQREVEEQQQLDDVQTTKQAEQQQQSEDSIEALCNCLMKCTMMQLQQDNEENDLLKKDCIENMPDASRNNMTKLEQKLEARPGATNKSAFSTDSIIDKIQLQLPSNVVRPEVIYYQTACTLELQIALPEDMLPYEVQLHNVCCIVFWTLTPAVYPTMPIYQFIVNTHCHFENLRHRMQGRTVYVSVLKALAVPYPLDFSFYKFMKPHYEKLHRMEKERRRRIKSFESFLLCNGYIPSRVLKRANSSDDLSSDDQADDPAVSGRERVERARDDCEFIYS